MIRGRLAQIQQGGGLCARCQYRLSIRRGPPSQQRPWSSTSSLRQSIPPGSNTPSSVPGAGGWGVPSGGGFRGGSGWGGSSLVKPAAATQAAETLLSPHELEQRKRLVAQQEAAKQPVQTPTPRPPFKHVFNAERQNAMHEGWKRDAKEKRRNPNPQGRLNLQLGTRLSAARPDRSRTTPPMASQRARADGPRIPQSEAPKESKMQTSESAITPMQNQRPDGPVAAQSSTEAPETKQGPFSLSSAPTPSSSPSAPVRPKAWGFMGRAPALDAPSYDRPSLNRQAPAPSNNSWSQLTRKQAAPKSEKTSEFFDNLLKREPSQFKKPADRPASDWGQISTTSAANGQMGDWGENLRDFSKDEKKADPYAANPNRKVVEVETPVEPVRASAPSSTTGKDRRERKGGRRGFEIEEEEAEEESRAPAKGKGKQKKAGKSGRGPSSRYEEDLEGDEVDGYEDYLERRRLKAERKAQKEAERTGPIPIKLPELISISALGSALKRQPAQFLDEMAELGFEGITMDSIMAGETAALVAQEYGYEPTVDIGVERDLKPRPPAEDPSILPQRPPVVTIMGHVDHGKTTLLDYLRKSSVAAQEHGGITQHIGAFSVKMSTGKQITFLDTPGHAAFLTMRQRGANVTDIVVLVVAADDSVKPQTLEALKHAQGAKVPIIVAINKVDKDTARVEQVKNDLSRHGVELEDFGGDVQVVCVSGKTGQGMDELEENIVTLAEILDMRAENDGPAEGWVLESSLKASGKVASVLVRRGTMRPGDIITAGTTFAKIRHLRNEAGLDVDEAGPGTAIEIYGWRDLPSAGDECIQAPDEGRARTAIEYREGLREQEQAASDHAAIAEERNEKEEQRKRFLATAREEVRGMGRGRYSAKKAIMEREIQAAAEEGAADDDGKSGPKLVNFAVKGDVHGSVEAVCASILEIGNHEVSPRILRSAAGPITEFDVEHAAMSGSVIVNFATTTPTHVKYAAEQAGVKIIDHTIIYHLVDDVKATLSSYLAPDISTKVLGEAEIQQVFAYNTKGRQFRNIAGCKVRNGVVTAGSLYRVFRDGEKIFDGKLETLKHHKKDVTEMRKGTECGMGFEEFQDLQAGDQIQAYEEIRTARKL